MLEVLKTAGTSAAFTVLEKKVTTLENPLLVHRYMVFGTDPRIFRRAVNFDDVPGIRPTAQGITEGFHFQFSRKTASTLTSSAKSSRAKRKLLLHKMIWRCHELTLS